MPSGGGVGESPILTSAQRKLLLRYREHRRKPFTLAGLLVPLLPRVALAAFLAAFSYIVMPRFAPFLAGLLLGAILNQVAMAVRGVRVISILPEVIDWEKVDRLLEESAGDA